MVLRNRKGYSCVGLEFSDVDLKLLQLYIAHHDLRDFRGNLLSVRGFLYSLCKSWIIDDLYKFRDVNNIGDLDLNLEEDKNGE